MKKLALSTLSLVGLAVLAVPSHAAPPDLTGPQGQKCAMNSATDVGTGPGIQFGVMRGGPLAGSGRLICTIHLNNNITHNSPYLVPPAGPGQIAYTGSGVVVGGLTTISYYATAADDVSVCAEWHPSDPNVPTLYWVGGNTGAARFGHWSIDPTSICGVATSIQPNDPECRIWHTIDNLAGTPIAETWQDCEPYPPLI
jgi:hypothetical protein